jgi:hypothetical protein
LHYFPYFSSHSTRNIQKIALFPFFFFIFHHIQRETFKKLHYFPYFSSHSTKNIQKIALFPLFSSFFIAFNKNYSKHFIISFIFHHIQQETFKKLHYFLYLLHFSSHSTRNIQKMHYFINFFFIFHRIQQETFKKLHYFLYFLHFASQ